MKASDLTCPACRTQLILLATAEGALWKCETCSGMAANLAVVRKRISDKTVREFWLKATTESVPSNRQCPCCAQKLNEFTAGTGEQWFHLDLCKTCQLMWFDRNELEAFPREQKANFRDARLDFAVPAVGFDTQFDREAGRDASFANLCIDILSIIIRLLVFRG